MKLIRHLLILVIFLCMTLSIAPTLPSFAHDTDLYMASGEGVEPNVLIIFDNSGSMNDEIQTRFYDHTITYDPSVVPVGNKDSVYRKSSGQWILWKNAISDVPCSTAQTALTNEGHYEGRADTGCSGTSRTLRTGNYRNYLATGGDQYETKLYIAKRVIRTFLNTINGVRLGVMVFNPVVNDYTSEGGSSHSNSNGGRIQSTIKSLTDANRTQLISDINAIVAETWTPLAETLYEAGLYFKGGASHFNSGVNYVSPLQYYCQRNYVVIITDGDSTRDQNSILGSTVGDRDGDGREPGGANRVYYIVNGQDMLGTDYLDDVAKYLYDTDLSSSFTGQQNITTYSIGFTVQSQHNLLERAATQGHGRYFYTETAQELANAFQNIVGEILEKTSSFVAPIVPVSRMEKTTAGDKIYLALFQPNQDRMWSGNIKKYRVVQSGTNVGQIVDMDGAPALDDHGQMFTTAHSYWPSPISENRMDGIDVERGGVGDILRNRSSARNIYTYLDTNINLSHASNGFTTANASITPDLLGLLASDNAGRDKLIRFIHGYDAYDDDGNGNTDEKRDWILGAFLHSRPLVVHYASQSVIFVGSNDGMLHAFNDDSGEELWAFIPRNLLNKLQALHADVLESFVDGSPKAYISYNTDGSISQAVLIFGERRGGNHYYAIDVTNPEAPRYLWKISPDMTGYAELGQSWSIPNIGKIASGQGEKWVAFLAGGYDENQDNDLVTLPDSEGRAVYVVDVLTGSLVWRYSYEENPAMTYSIPSDIARVDTDGNGRIDRLYVGDMGGRMWRFDIGDPDPANWTGKIIFAASTGSKIFYPPEVTLEKDSVNYEVLLFGTGDREHPKASSVINRLYAFKDKNPISPMTEDNLIDVTQDLLQSPSTSDEQKNTIMGQMMAGNGWYIRLDTNNGEKCLAPPVIFYKIVYFTTFSPSSEGSGSDPCYVGEGTARVYALQYNTGNAVFNLDLTNDTNGTVISRSDRSQVIGTAIPSGVIITFVQGVAVAYTGVGGGVYYPPLSNKKSLLLSSWQIVF